MTLRRVLALVMTAVAVMTSAGAAMAAAPAAPSSTKQCVALVVDGRALGSDVSTSCVTVRRDATGVDVLQAAGHTVGFRNDGLLCTIDGLPKTGCTDIDDSHYWAYFHRAPGSTHWVYSSEGASTYEPESDSTEGWVYDNGKALTPENVPFAQICRCQPAPSPTPTHAVTHSPTPKPPTSPTHHPTPSATPTPTPTPTTVTPSPTPSKTHPARRRHRPSSVTSLLTATITATPRPAPTPSPTSVALAGAVTPPSNGHGLVDLLVVLIIVAALGTAAALRSRRRTS
jgi:cell division septation protein DedD